MNNDKEIWAWIDGYEGQYMVSTHGRVCSVARKRRNHGKLQDVKQRIKNPGDNGHGYKIVNLCSDGKCKMFYIHRLVAMTFIPNPQNLSQVNHKDEDKSNNRIDNLEWCNQKYNVNYGTVRARSRSTMLIKDKNRGIDMYDMDGNFIKTYQFSNEACKELGVSRRLLYATCNGITRSAKGHRFTFEGEKLRPYHNGVKIKHIVHKVDLNGNIVAQYNSFHDADSLNGFCRGTMRNNFIKNNGEFIKNGYKYKQIS